MPIEPTIDVVIAVHDPGRDVARAVRSVLHDGVAGVRVLVVCHGLPASAFEREAFAGRPVEWLEFADGIPSPAGPFTYGLATATADYVTIMGSDDFLQPGAVAAAAAHLRTDAPDALVLPLQHQSGEVLRTPLARRGRVHRLDPVRDRLAYRTAPLAYLRRGLLDELGLVLTPGLPSGEDIDFSAKLWFSGASVDFHPGDPAYVIGADAETRVTTAPVPAAVELTAISALLAQRWVRESPRRERTSLVIKVLRIHVLGSVLRRAADGRLDDADVAAFGEVVDAALALAPGATRPFSLADRAVLDALGRRPAEPAAVRRAAQAHSRAGRIRGILPRNPLAALDREGALRRFLRYRSWP